MNDEAYSPLTQRLIRDGLAQPAHIEDGPELDRALASLGLRRADAPAKPSLWARAISYAVWVLAWVGVAAILWGGISFALWAIDLWRPIQVAG